MLGTWTSPSCGSRRYERRLTLESGGRVRGEERVSPCPPNVPCVWSGVVPWQGTWRTEGDRIVITPDADAPRNPAATLPTELRWDTGASAITEAASGTSCTYARGA